MEKTSILQSDNKKIDKSQFEEVAYLLKAIAHETRLCVVMQLLKNEELNVSELREYMECEQSLLSHHLTDMRAKGVLNCRRSGKNNYYSLKDKRIANVMKCLINCEDNSSETKLSEINLNKLN